MGRDYCWYWKSETQQVVVARPDVLNRLDLDYQFEDYNLACGKCGENLPDDDLLLLRVIGWENPETSKELTIVNYMKEVCVPCSHDLQNVCITYDYADDKYKSVGDHISSLTKMYDKIVDIRGKRMTHPESYLGDVCAFKKIPYFMGENQNK